MSLVTAVRRSGGARIYGEWPPCDNKPACQGKGKQFQGVGNRGLASAAASISLPIRLNTALCGRNW